MIEEISGVLVPADFKHKKTFRVRFNEVDMLGVCNNVVYIKFFEEGRIQYLKHNHLIPPNGIFSDGSLFYIVRNVINYRGLSRYDDEVDVFNRVSFIKHSSYGFEHLIINNTTGETIADGSGVIVRVDPATGKSTPLDEKFYEVIQSFEPNVKILK